jgi:hypothetical protein
MMQLVSLMELNFSLLPAYVLYCAQCTSYATPLYDLPIDAAINQDLLDTGNTIFIKHFPPRCFC